MTISFNNDQRIFRNTLAQELGSPVQDSVIPGSINNTTFYSIQGYHIVPESNFAYLYTLQAVYHHNIHHVPHGFVIKAIQVFGGECPSDTRDDNAIAYLDHRISDNLKTYWGSTGGTFNDAAEIARICADNIKQRIADNALTRLI